MKVKAENIAEKALELFIQKGLNEVSMEEIGFNSGVSQETLYRNFEKKELIVNAIVQKLIQDTCKYLWIGADISPNALREIENFSEHILGELENLTPKFLRGLKKYYPDIYSQFIAFKNNSIIPYLETCLFRGITEDIFRHNLNKRNTGWIYCQKIQNALEGDSSEEETLSIIENANALFLIGILNSKGMKLMSKQNEKTERNKKSGSG